MQFGQFREFFPGRLQRFPQALQPLRQGLERLQGIVDLFGLRAQVHAAVYRFQGHALVVLCIALQLYAGVVLNGAVQHPRRHGHLGAGIVVHLVGFPGR